MTAADGGRIRLRLSEAAMAATGAPGGWTRIKIERRSDAAPVGEVGLQFHADRRLVELGYALAPAARGQGLAAEALAAVLQWLWRTTPAAAVACVVAADNAASRRLLARLGFVCRAPAAGHWVLARPAPAPTRAAG